MSFLENFPEDSLFPSEDFIEDFGPVETPELPVYTPLTDLNLDSQTLGTPYPEDDDPEASKFPPCTPGERLALVRKYVDMLVGNDAKIVVSEFLANSGEAGDRGAAPHVTHLSIGTLDTGEVVVVATDTATGMINNPNREKSVNLAKGNADDVPLKGAALTHALEKTGENGRGFMITSALAADHKTHYTPTAGGKNVWVILPKPTFRREDTELAA